MGIATFDRRRVGTTCGRRNEVVIESPFPGFTGTCPGLRLLPFAGQFLLLLGRFVQRLLSLAAGRFGLPLQRCIRRLLKLLKCLPRRTLHASFRDGVVHKQGQQAADENAGRDS